MRVSSQFRITIPQEMRKAFRLEAGSMVSIFHHNGNIVIVLRRKIQQGRGFLKGIATEVRKEDQCDL
ncbi:MAG: AbrB/MazE/SpoVT family DNA-binding domain-containing protein [Candidatus Omnitrophica bacterium]|nr:AbrB/MazE/SpoVT family DNA-binding domain-containing protein [Candidatus Omnitrophota bacterium]